MLNTNEAPAALLVVTRSRGLFFFGSDFCFLYLFSYIISCRLLSATLKQMYFLNRAWNIYAADSLPAAEREQRPGRAGDARESEGRGDLGICQQCHSVVTWDLWATQARWPQESSAQRPAVHHAGREARFWPLQESRPQLDQCLF